MKPVSPSARRWAHCWLQRLVPAQTILRGLVPAQTRSLWVGERRLVKVVGSAVFGPAVFVAAVCMPVEIAAAQSVAAPGQTPSA